MLIFCLKVNATLMKIMSDMEALRDIETILIFYLVLTVHKKHNGKLY